MLMLILNLLSSVSNNAWGRRGQSHAHSKFLQKFFQLFFFFRTFFVPLLLLQILSHKNKNYTTRFSSFMPFQLLLFSILLLIFYKLFNFFYKYFTISNTLYKLQIYIQTYNLNYLSFYYRVQSNYTVHQDLVLLLLLSTILPFHLTFYSVTQHCITSYYSTLFNQFQHF